VNLQNLQNLQAVLEGLLFVVGEEGLTLSQMEEVLEITEEEAKELVKSLRAEYEKSLRGLRIDFLGNKFKLTTKKEHCKYYQKLIENPNSNGFTPSVLEVLAIIAYNQPITRVEIDEMRGVSSAQIIRKLVAKGLIKEVGKSKLPGRPNLYRTTHEFLDAFGLANLDELPEFEEDIASDSETELFTSIYKEDNNEVGI